MESLKIGVVLGLGGVRGFVYLGVIKMLIENNIFIDFLVGSSMGVLVGVLYVLGIELVIFYKMVLMFKWKYYLDFIVFKMGFIMGNRVKLLVCIFM